MISRTLNNITPPGSGDDGTPEKGGGRTRPDVKLHLRGFGWAAIACSTGCQALGGLLTLIFALFAAPMPQHWSLAFRLAVSLPLPVLGVVIPAGLLVGTLLWLAPEIRSRPLRPRPTRMALLRQASIAATIFAGAETALGAWQCTVFWVTSLGAHWPAFTAIYHILFWASVLLEPLYLWWLWSVVLVTGDWRNPSWPGRLALALTWVWPGLSAYGAVVDLFGRWAFLTDKAVGGTTPPRLSLVVPWPQWIGLVASVVAAVASLVVLSAFRKRCETGGDAEG